MKFKGCSIVKFASIASMLVVFPACPPEGAAGGGIFAIDMKNYWPMAVGNAWDFQSKTRDNEYSVYTVVEDLSSQFNDAFGIESVSYRDNVAIQTSMQYYIWRHDYLVRTPSRDKAIEVMASPSAPATGLDIEIELPRYTYPSNSPRLFIDEGPVERRYTQTGRLDQLYGVYECPNDDVPPLPDYLAVAHDSSGVLQQGEIGCDQVITITGSRFFVQGVGPVELHNSFLSGFAVN